MTTCGDWKMLGGYNVAGKGASFERTWSIDRHYKYLTVKFNMYKMDSWDNETYFVDVNGERFYQESFKHN